MNIDANKGLSFIDKLLCYGFAIGLVGLFYFLHGHLVNLSKLTLVVDIIFVLVSFSSIIAYACDDILGKLSFLSYQLIKLLSLFLLSLNIIILIDYQRIFNLDYSIIIISSLIYILIFLFILIIVKSPVLARLRTKSYEPKVKRDKPKFFKKVNFK